MAEIFGALGIKDSDYVFTQVPGQMVVWNMTQRVFDQYNQDMETALSLFVQGTTEAFKERYYLPGGGEAQEEDISSAAETASVKPIGSWDVAYPIKQYGDSLSWDNIGIRFVSLAHYEATVKSIMMRNNNSVFRAVLRALLKNTSTSFTDNVNGTLTLVPLANSDGTLYPPPYGTTAEAQQSFYIGTSYAESAISSANNPFAAIRDKLEPMYGFPQGGSPIVALVNTSTVQYAQNLPGFTEYTNRYIVPGVDLATVSNLPALPDGMMRVVGVDSVSGVVIVEWPRLPSGYIIGLHQDAPKPLMKRVDPGVLNIPGGLHMWSKTLANSEPYETARWRNRLGFGVGNRIGAVVVHLSGDGSYHIPSGYS